MLFFLLFLEPPASPSGPLVVEQVGDTAATLSWQPPELDGGAPVTNYLIEGQDSVSKKWYMMKDKPATDLTLEADKLEHDREYQFRVSAKNPAGISKPLETTEAFRLRKLEQPEGQNKFLFKERKNNE